MRIPNNAWLPPMSVDGVGNCTLPTSTFLKISSSLPEKPILKRLFKSNCWRVFQSTPSRSLSPMRPVTFKLMSCVKNGPDCVCPNGEAVPIFWESHCQPARTLTSPATLMLISGLPKILSKGFGGMGMDNPVA